MYNMHLIINTHWDREYRWSFSETQFRLAEAVDDLIDIMQKDPGFAYFHTDSQSSMLDDYLDIRPERAEELKKLVADGRILTGPWYTLPAEFLVSGEALTRNLLMGHKIANRLGRVMKAGYNIFSWGQVSQLPQIYHQFGMDTIVFYRGVDQSKLKTLEFQWEAPDGTRVLGLTFGAYHRLNFWRYVYLPYILGGDSVDGDNHKISREHLGDAYLTHLCDDQIDMVNHVVHNQPCARDLDAALAGMQDLLATVADKSSVEDLLFLQGFDQENPDPVVTELVKRINERIDYGTLTISSLEDYLATLESKLRERGILPALPVLSGEMLEVEKVHDAFGPLYNGVFSARMPVKLRNAQCQALLSGRAEPAAVWGMIAGLPYPAVSMERAWKTLLQNQQHDGIGGCHVDRVTETMLERFSQTMDLGETIVKNSLCALAGRVDLSHLGDREIGVVFYNFGFTPYTGVVNCLVDIPHEWNVRYSGSSRRDFYLKAVGADGRALDCQVLRLDDDTVYGYLKFGNVIGYPATRCRVSLWMENIPANGYTTVRLTPYVLKQAARHPIANRVNHMENAYLAVQITSNGSLAVTDKISGRTYTDLHYFEDCSDKGGPLKFDPTQDKGLETTLSCSPSIQLLTNGELEATYRIAYAWDLPECVEADLHIHVPHGSEWVDMGSLHRSERRKTVTLSVDVTLHRDSRSLYFTTTVDNTVRDHRLRVVFPTSLASASFSRADSPYDVVERPIAVPDSTGWYEEASRTWPTTSFVSVGEGEDQITAYHAGLSEYEVTDDDSRSIALTLLRCFSTAGNPTETYRYQELAECLGRHTFRYALELGSASRAQLQQRAFQFNTRPHAVQTTRHAGDWEQEKTFFRVSDSRFVVTALKKAEDSDAIVLRGYSEADAPIQVTVSACFPLKSAHQITLEERIVEELPVHGTETSWIIHPKEIAGILLFPAG